MIIGLCRKGRRTRYDAFRLYTNRGVGCDGGSVNWSGGKGKS
jgi:hypothetical protein